MTSKELYLSKLYAIGQAIAALPDDVKICRIYDDVNPDRIKIHILEHPDVQGERVDKHHCGDWWCEVPGEVTVGYLHRMRVAHQCSECGEPIYEEDPCQEYSFGWVCEECAEKAKRIAEV